MSRAAASPRALIVALRDETDSVSVTQMWPGPKHSGVHNAETTAEPAPKNDAPTLTDYKAVLDFAMSRTAFEPEQQHVYNAAVRAQRAVREAERRLRPPEEVSR